MESSEDRKRCLFEISQDYFEDQVNTKSKKKFKDGLEEAVNSTGTLVEHEFKKEAYDSEEEEDAFFGVVNNHNEELNISEYRSTSSVLDEFDHASLLHAQGFSCFLNEDGDMVLDQISATFNNNYARDEYIIQPIIQEAPESPPTFNSPQDSPQISRLDSLPTANRKIPTSSWYSLIQDALDNMEGEATAREMVEYFEKNHKSHPFMKKTHWKQTVYTYLSKYFEKKFVGGSRDTIYTYTRASNDGNTEVKSISRKKSKRSQSKVHSTILNSNTIESSPYSRITRRIQAQISDPLIQPYMMPRVPPIK